MGNSYPYPLGTLVRSYHGDSDRDSDHSVRTAPPGSIGRVVAVQFHPTQPKGARWHHSVVYPNGVWVTLFEEDLDNPEEYALVTKEEDARTLSHEAAQELEMFLKGYTLEHAIEKLAEHMATRHHAHTGHWVSYLTALQKIMQNPTHDLELDGTCEAYRDIIETLKQRAIRSHGTVEQLESQRLAEWFQYALTSLGEPSRMGKFVVMDGDHNPRRFSTADEAQKTFSELLAQRAALQERRIQEFRCPPAPKFESRPEYAGIFEQIEKELIDTAKRYDSAIPGVEHLRDLIKDFKETLQQVWASVETEKKARRVPRSQGVHIEEGIRFDIDHPDFV